MYQQPFKLRYVASNFGFERYSVTFGITGSSGEWKIIFDM